MCLLHLMLCYLFLICRFIYVALSVGGVTLWVSKALGSFFEFAERHKGNDGSFLCETLRIRRRVLTPWKQFMKLNCNGRDVFRAKSLVLAYWLRFCTNFQRSWKMLLLVDLIICFGFQTGATGAVFILSSLVFLLELLPINSGITKYCLNTFIMCLLPWILVYVLYLFQICAVIQYWTLSLYRSFL